jgi:hypothetical protein
MASCLPLQPTFKCFPVPAIAVFLIFFSGYKKKKNSLFKEESEQQKEAIWYNKMQY